MDGFDISLKLGVLEFDTAEAAAENVFLGLFQDYFYQPDEFVVTDTVTGEVTIVDLTPLHTETTIFNRSGLSDRLRQPVKLVISDSFLVPGKGTVLTGEIKAGILKNGDLLILNSNRNSLTLHVSAIELNRQFVDEAFFSEQVGVLFSGVDLSFACAGDVLLGTR